MSLAAGIASSLSVWDGVLVLGVSLQTTLLAFVRRPRAKALLYSFPGPFTIANLALGRPIGTAHMLGYLTLLMFMLLVRWLHCRLRAPIVASIVASAAAYCVVGAALNAVVPLTTAAFWVAFGAVLATGVGLAIALPYRAEPGHRSDLPVPVKFAVVAAVISGLVALKGVLGGFMATFPMVGVVATYEARHSLWTMVRQTPLVILSLGSMAASMWVAQQAFAFTIAQSLAVGWLVCLAVLIPATIARWRREPA
jgi:hypothetical protein